MRRFIAIGFSCILLGSPAFADLLVTREGGQIETRGPWKVKGRSVVFTAANGNLSSLRLDEVDLEASEAATARAAQAAQEAATAAAQAASLTGAPKAEKRVKKEPVLVITDADIPQAAAVAEGLASVRALTIAGWKIRPLEGDPAFELVGTVRNSGSETVDDIVIDATLSADDGETSMAVVLAVEKTTLDPDDTSTFRANFSQQRVEGSGFADTFAEAKVTFAPQGRIRPEEPGELVDTGAEPEAQ